MRLINLKKLVIGFGVLIFIGVVCPSMNHANLQSPIEIFVLPEKRVSSGNSISVKVKASSESPLADAMLSLELPQIGKFPPKSIVLWSGSTDTGKDFEFDYNISGLVNGKYRIIATLTFSTGDSPQLTIREYLYVKVSDFGIFSSVASINTETLELKERIKKRGFSNLSEEDLKKEAPDLFKIKQDLRTIKSAPPLGREIKGVKVESGQMAEKPPKKSHDELVEELSPNRNKGAK